MIAVIEKKKDFMSSSPIGGAAVLSIRSETESNLDDSFLSEEILELPETPSDSDIAAATLPAVATASLLTPPISGSLGTILGSKLEFATRKLEAYVREVAYYSKERGTLSSLDSDFLIKSRFTFKGYFEVSRFIANDIALQGLLLEIWVKIKQYFGKAAGAVLEVKKDIYEPDFITLFITIKSRDDLTARMANLERFELEWWFERSGHLNDSPVIMLAP